jgi:hypothetical protein
VTRKRGSRKSTTLRSWLGKGWRVPKKFSCERGELVESRNAGVRLKGRGRRIGAERNEVGGWVHYPVRHGLSCCFR